MYEGHESKYKREKTMFFPQIIAYTNFERTVKRRIFAGIFHSWSALTDPCFKLKLKVTEQIARFL